MATPRRTQYLLAAKFAFSGLLLWIVLTRLDFHGILLRMRGADARWLVLALLASPAAIAISAWRWQILSQGLLTYGPALRYTWIGVFFGSVVPGMVSGDLAKGLSLAAKSARTRDERLPVSIFFDKLIGLWVLLVFFCVVVLALLATRPQALAGLRGLATFGAAGALAGLAGGTGVLHPAGVRWGRRLAPALPFAWSRSLAERTLDALARYAAEPRLIGRAVALSALMHAVNSLAFWLVLHALAVPANLFFAAAVYPLLSLLLAVPVSISGIGVRDVFLFSLFKAFGLNPEAGLAFSWLLLALNLPAIAVGALIQLWEVFR